MGIPLQEEVPVIHYDCPSEGCGQLLQHHNLQLIFQGFEPLAVPLHYNQPMEVLRHLVYGKCSKYCTKYSNTIGIVLNIVTL